MPLIPALGRQRQMDLCEFEAGLVYRASSRTASYILYCQPQALLGTRLSALVTLRRLLKNPRVPFMHGL